MTIDYSTPAPYARHVYCVSVFQVGWSLEVDTKKNGRLDRTPTAAAISQNAAASALYYRQDAVMHRLNVLNRAGASSIVSEYAIGSDLGHLT